MIVTADTNVFLAVAMDEPERAWVIAATVGHELIAPEVLPLELGNALTALVKRRALNPGDVRHLWSVVERVPVQLRKVNVAAALDIACRNGIYAYDAYFLECAMATQSPLLTLDERLRAVARGLNIAVLEQFP